MSIENEKENEKKIKILEKFCMDFVRLIDFLVR